MKCAAYRLGLVEGQSILCLSSQTQLGSELSLPLQSTFPHILPAAGPSEPTESQVTPYKQFWACNGKTALGELREKGDMETLVGAPCQAPQLCAAAQLFHLHHTAHIGL